MARRRASSRADRAACRGRAHLRRLQSAVFAVIGIFFVGYGLANAGLSAFWMLGGVFLLYAAGLGVGRAVRYVCSEFAITNKRVLIKVGFIHRHTLEMLLTKVETVRVDQGMVARLVGYGTLVVTGTGGTNEPFRSIAYPLEFRKQVQARAAGCTPAPGPPRPTFRATACRQRSRSSSRRG